MVLDYLVDQYRDIIPTPRLQDAWLEITRASQIQIKGQDGVSINPGYQSSRTWLRKRTGYYNEYNEYSTHLKRAKAEDRATH